MKLLAEWRIVRGHLFGIAMALLAWLAVFLAGGSFGERVVRSPVEPSTRAGEAAGLAITAMSF